MGRTGCRGENEENPLHLDRKINVSLLDSSFQRLRLQIIKECKMINICYKIFFNCFVLTLKLYYNIFKLKNTIIKSILQFIYKKLCKFGFLL